MKRHFNFFTIQNRFYQNFLKLNLLKYLLLHISLGLKVFGAKLGNLLIVIIRAYIN